MTEDAKSKIARMGQPEALAKAEPLKWSAGLGTDVWELFCAAIAGDTAAIRQLLEKDPGLVRSAYDYRTPLYFAVRENQLAAAALLIGHGANPVDSGTPDTLLQIARDRGHVEMEALLQSALGKSEGQPGGERIAEAIRSRDLSQVKQWLDEKPELVHARDEHSNQPIHWAVMTRQPDMIDELLRRGADIDARRADGAQPVQLVNGDYHFRGWMHDFPVRPIEILDHLRAKGALIDICTAAWTGDLDRVQELLRQDPSLANQVSPYTSYYIGSGAPLKNAAARGHFAIVELLLEYGADPNLREEGIAPHGHALYAAVSNGHIAIVKLLLEHGAVPNPEVESSADALSIAMSRNDQPMIELLCMHGAARAVHMLAYYGDTPTAAAVFAADPSLARDVYALECAATEGKESFVRLMLHYQPELARRIAVGVRSQGPDASVKSRELAEFLFSQGMNAGHRGWLGITPLHRFAQRGDTENALLFIRHGADLHARDEELSSTPLGWAAKYGKTAMVKLLLEQGASTNLPDDPDWATPLAWAMRRGHAEIVTLLQQHGAV
ncbi:MAG: ankyrin repeat domain-containing protein [Chitinophagaceae bacterium]